MAALKKEDFRALALLRHGAFVRIGGEWRFGLARIGDSVVERLVAAHRVTHYFPGQAGRGECVVLKDQPSDMKGAA